MRKSSSECSRSSSVPGQVFVGLCENLWTLFAISEMGPGQVGSVWPLSSRSSPSPDVPLGILHLRMSHPWGVSGPPGWEAFVCPCHRLTEWTFCAVLENHSRPLDLHPWLDSQLPVWHCGFLQHRVWGQQPAFLAGGCLLLSKDMSGNLLRLALYPDRPQLGGDMECEQHWCCWTSWSLELSSCRISLVCFSSSFQESILASYVPNVPQS